MRRREKVLAPYLEMIASGIENKLNAARKLYAENPGLWPSKEAARMSICHATGSRGDRSRLDREDFRSSIVEGLRAVKRHKGTAKKNVVLRGRVAILSDVHIPYHDVQALETALIACVEAGCEHLVLNGDILDFYQLSRYEREPHYEGFHEELQAWREFAKTVRPLFPGRVVYKEGNHEERLRSYLLRQAKEIAQIEELRLENLLGLDDLQIELVGREPIRCGKLGVLHGHEFGESIFSPVNPARGLFLRAKASTIIGHHHQSSHHSEGNLNGDRIGCWSLGALCDLSPAYRPFAFTRWNHGFAIVDVEDSGEFHVQNKTIIDGKVY